MPRKIESHFIAGPAGRLEALLEEPDLESAELAHTNQPKEICLVCHPHPLFGGTMLNKVVYRMARGLRRSGSVVLRFNFRGVGMSEGKHDDGVGEVEDARAALFWLQTRYPDLPYSLAGFSFGSRAILRLGCTLAGPVRLIAAGFATIYNDFQHLESCAHPKFFVQSTHDEFGPKPDLEAAFATFADPKKLIFIQARDHFFDGALDQFEEAVRCL